jgi:hypothetical protein
MYIRDWETDPEAEIRFFERLRGDAPPLHVAPGILFPRASNLSGFPDETIKSYDPCLYGFFFLAACYRWEAYFFSDIFSNYLHIADGRITISTVDPNIVREAAAIFAGFNLSFSGGQ